MEKRKRTKSTVVWPYVIFALLSLWFLYAGYPEITINRDNSSSSSISKDKKDYDPRKCANMVNGHCDSVGAWSYHKGEASDGECVHTEQNVPRASNTVEFLPKLFPDATSVLDFGGGVGAYLVGFRDATTDENKKRKLVVVEPNDLGKCLFRGLIQDTTDWANTPLSKLPQNEYDLVMTIECLEHVPVQYHEHIVKALARASREYIVFSAAHPGQPGEGHVGPSMKTREEWIDQVRQWTGFRVDQEKTDQLHANSPLLLRRNSVVFRK